jgi:flagellin-like protein
MGQRFYITSAILNLGPDMLRKPMRGDRRAVSPVIATIILVAVAIVMSIAVAYWALGLGGTFTRYEKIEIMSMYATKESGDGWKITANLRNTGSAPATINMILINGKPTDAYGSSISVDPDLSTGVTLNPGGTQLFEITISPDSDFSSGMSVEVTFHTAAGSDYPKVIVLP